MWIEFFKYLGYKVIISPPSNKKVLDNGTRISNDEACLSLKMFLGHVLELKNKCDVVLIPRLFSIKRGEQVCTNFNCLYDLTRNLIDIDIINYNIDLTENKNKLLAYLSLGEALGEAYIRSYTAYKYAEERNIIKRRQKEKKQEELLQLDGIKILLAGHPYNLYDELIGKVVSKYLEENNIIVLYSDSIDHNIIDSECLKISRDIHWTHSKEVMASIHYYQDKVDGIITLSSFPCGPDSLSNELVSHRIKNTPLINLIFEDLNSETGVITRLESFIDILSSIKEAKVEKNN